MCLTFWPMNYGSKNERREVTPMVMGCIVLGMLCVGVYSGFCISRAVTKYEMLHEGEYWGNE